MLTVTPVAAVTTLPIEKLPAGDVVPWLSRRLLLLVHEARQIRTAARAAQAG